MKSYFIIMIISSFTICSCAVSKNITSPELINQISKDARGGDMLLGKCTRAALMQAPFAEWFKSNYDSYVVDSFTCNFIRPLLAGKTITIFLGTWCGDSKREVPRVLKMLDCCNFPEQNLTLVMVSNKDSLYKKSPQHEEAGKGIFRVPTVIVYRNGVELNRINEFPVTSLENDLYTILSRQSYSPNYKTFSFISSWLVNGGLLNKNISARSLAAQLRHLTEGEHELNSLAYLLAKQGMKEEALKIFQVNYLLYPESANVVSGLGEGYYKAGDVKNAIVYLEKSLELNKDPRMIKGILTVLYEAKGLK